MSQNDTRAQRQREHDERRLSIQRNNAYFSYVSPTIPNADIERSITHSPRNLLLPTNQERARSCSPALLAPTEAPLPPTTTAGEGPAARSASSSAAPAHGLTKSAKAKPLAINGTAALPAKQNENVNKKAGSTWQTGMDRYITIKRKLSPENSDLGNKPKNTRDNSTLIKNVAPANTNRFALLVDTAEDVPLGSVDIEPKKTKPPPIYIREKSTSRLVNTLIGLIGKDSFHIIPVVKGTINEIKLQTKTEDDYRKVTNYFTAQKIGFYTYQLKSSNGLQVV
ncbi:orf1 for rna binding protein, partial [Lasius niger]